MLIAHMFEIVYPAEPTDPLLECFGLAGGIGQRGDSAVGASGVFPDGASHGPGDHQSSVVGTAFVGEQQ